MSIRIAKQFDKVVKTVQEHEGGVTVLLYDPYRIEADINLGIKVADGGIGYSVPKKNFRASLDKIFRKDPLEITLRNDNCYCLIRWAKAKDSRPGFTVKDLTDLDNEYTCYNTSYRGIDNVLFEIVNQFGPDTKLKDISNIATNSGVHVHSYCARD